MNNHLNYLIRIFSKTVPLYLLIVGIISIILTDSVSILTVIRFPIINYFIPNNDIYYIGYPLSFITYGVITSIFYYKFRTMAIPIFILNYTTWEIVVQGITPIGNTKLIPFIGLMVLCIPSFILLIKKMDISPSLLALFLYWFISVQAFNPWNFYHQFPQFNISEIVSESLWAFVAYRSINRKPDDDYIC